MSTEPKNPRVQELLEIMSRYESDCCGAPVSIIDPTLALCFECCRYCTISEVPR